MNIKRIPYGKGDFEAVNALNDYYVDKTMFIPKVEMTPFIFLVRPRRFGKTLFLSMLESYYDIRKKDRFAEFYHDTWILKNPTRERASYMILYFNFSMISKDKDKVQKDFDNYCSLCISDFILRYNSYLPESLIEKTNRADTSHEKLQILSIGLRDSKYKIYLLIDEYDNFTNTLLAEYGPSEYNKITKQSGYYKQFFTVLKGIASGSSSGLARMFITGVSPVTMDDVTSGFNIGDNISIDPEFNDILGFTEKDTNDIIDYYISVGVFHLDKEDTVQVMKKWYDNYIFSRNSTQAVFNTDAVLYFMKRAWNSKYMLYNLIDDNLRMDYGKLRQLIILDQKLNGNFSILKKIIANGGIASSINTSFPYEELIQKINFISLLYFLGLLSFTGRYDQGLPYLAIPNEAIKKMMYEYLRRSYDDIGAFAIDIFLLQSRLQAMAYKGDFKPVFEFIADEINRQTRIRDFIHGEKVIQNFFMSYLNIFDFYISLSEQELQKGYADIVMKPFYIKYSDIKYAYLFEFKYIPRTKDKKKLGSLLKKKINQSKSQLNKYSDDEFAVRMFNMPPHGEVSLKKGIIIFHGWELVFIEEIK